MIARATVADGTAPISEQAVHALAADGPSRHLVCTVENRPVGYAHLEPGHGDHPAMAEVVVDPAERGPVSVADWWPRYSRRADPALGCGRTATCLPRSRSRGGSVSPAPGNCCSCVARSQPRPARRRGAGRRHAADLPWTRGRRGVAARQRGRLRVAPRAGDVDAARDRRAPRRAVVRSRGAVPGLPVGRGHESSPGLPLDQGARARERRPRAGGGVRGRHRPRRAGPGPGPSAHARRPAPSA